jgi:hypothetical protein
MIQSSSVFFDLLIDAGSLRAVPKRDPDEECRLPRSELPILDLCTSDTRIGCRGVIITTNIVPVLGSRGLSCACCALAGARRGSAVPLCQSRRHSRRAWSTSVLMSRSTSSPSFSDDTPGRPPGACRPTSIRGSKHRLKLAHRGGRAPPATVEGISAFQAGRVRTSPSTFETDRVLRGHATVPRHGVRTQRPSQARQPRRWSSVPPT